MTTTPIPHHTDTEMVLLALLLGDNRHIEKATSQLKSTDFFNRAFQIVYDAICNLHDSRKFVDHLTLAEELTRTRHLEAIGGADFILNLLGQFPKVPEIDEYIKTIKRYAKRRDLMQAGQKIIRLGQDDDQDIDEAMMQAEQTLAKVVRTATGDTVVSAADAADALLSNLALIHSDQLAPRLPISLPLLSRLLRGWVLGQHTVVAAPTEVGKAPLAVH